MAGAWTVQIGGRCLDSGGRCLVAGVWWQVSGGGRCMYSPYIRLLLTMAESGKLLKLGGLQGLVISFRPTQGRFVGALTASGAPPAFWKGKNTKINAR